VVGVHLPPDLRTTPLNLPREAAVFANLAVAIVVGQWLAARQADAALAGAGRSRRAIAQAVQAKGHRKQAWQAALRKPWDPIIHSESHRPPSLPRSRGDPEGGTTTFPIPFSDHTHGWKNSASIQPVKLASTHLRRTANPPVSPGGADWQAKTEEWLSKTTGPLIDGPDERPGFRLRKKANPPSPLPQKA
jgi:hypothetical protein